MQAMDELLPVTTVQECQVENENTIPVSCYHVDEGSQSQFLHTPSSGGDDVGKVTIVEMDSTQSQQHTQPLAEQVAEESLPSHLLENAQTIQLSEEEMEEQNHQQEESLPPFYPPTPEGDVIISLSPSCSSIASTDGSPMPPLNTRGRKKAADKSKSKKVTPYSSTRTRSLSPTQEDLVKDQQGSHIDFLQEHMEFERRTTRSQTERRGGEPLIIPIDSPSKKRGSSKLEQSNTKRPTVPSPLLHPPLEKTGSPRRLSPDITHIANGTPRSSRSGTRSRSKRNKEDAQSPVGPSLEGLERNLRVRRSAKKLNFSPPRRTIRSILHAAQPKLPLEIDNASRPTSPSSACGRKRKSVSFANTAATAFISEQNGDPTGPSQPKKHRRAHTKPLSPPLSVNVSQPFCPISFPDTLGTSDVEVVNESQPIQLNVTQIDGGCIHKEDERIPQEEPVPTVQPKTGIQNITITIDSPDPDTHDTSSTPSPTTPDHDSAEFFQASEPIRLADYDKPAYPGLVNCVDAISDSSFLLVQLSTQATSALFNIQESLAHNGIITVGQLCALSWAKLRVVLPIAQGRGDIDTRGHFEDIMAKYEESRKERTRGSVGEKVHEDSAQHSTSMGLKTHLRDVHEDQNQERELPISIDAVGSISSELTTTTITNPSLINVIRDKENLSEDDVQLDESCRFDSVSNSLLANMSMPPNVTEAAMSTTRQDEEDDLPNSASPPYSPLTQRSPSRFQNLSQSQIFSGGVVVDASVQTEDEGKGTFVFPPSTPPPHPILSQILDKVQILEARLTKNKAQTAHVDTQTDSLPSSLVDLMSAAILKNPDTANFCNMLFSRLVSNDDNKNSNDERSFLNTVGLVAAEYSDVSQDNALQKSS